MILLALFIVFIGLLEAKIITDPAGKQVHINSTTDITNQ